jgi:hypothetical protein
MDSKDRGLNTWGETKMHKIFLLILLIWMTAGATINAQEVKNLNIEKINISSDLRLEGRFDYTIYYGVLQSQKELDDIWAHLVSIKNDAHEWNRWLPMVKGDVPSPPRIDFEQYSVVWYATEGKGVSFVDTIEARDYPDKIMVKVTAVHSDYLTNELNLWKIPKVNKTVLFEEKFRSDGTTHGHY